MSEPDAVQAHVERTTNPAELRWVCHEPAWVAAALDDSGPDALRSLVDDGIVASMRADGGDLFVYVDDPARWSEAARVVHDAVVAALDAARQRRPEDGGHDPVAAVPTVATIQAAVDRSAGWLAAGHGGAIEVVAVEAGTVTLRMLGACHGCSSTADTIAGPVGAAIRRVHPDATIVVESPSLGHRGRSITLPHPGR